MEPNIDFDSCEERWKYYQQRYPKFRISLDKVVYDKDGRGKYKYEFVDLSGDCFFNFNDQKVEAFVNNINPDAKLKERLNYCATKHHSNENCVLMPVTGGMNNVKGKIYYRDKGFVVAGNWKSTKAYDRPDTFIFYLNEFYEHKKKKSGLLDAGQYLSNSVFKEALKSFNYVTLYQFLDSFDDINHFCDLFYGIDNNFVKRMISEGKQPILKTKHLERYIELAEDFWTIQENLVNQ